MGSSPRLLLAPGASGKLEKLRPLLRLLKARDIPGAAVALPRGPAERALPAWRAAVASAANDAGLFIGGQSFGGRVASLLAAELPASTQPAVAGLVLLCFPLHPPGRPERAAERSAHFGSIACPVLLLSGESDPFAQLPLLRRAVGRLAHAELVTYPKVGHSLAPVLADAAERIAAFIAAHPVRTGAETPGP